MGAGSRAVYYSQTAGGLRVQLVPSIRGVRRGRRVDLDVEVDGIASKVISYCAPPVPPKSINTMPRIPREQAERIAAQYTAKGPLRYPFDEVWLRAGQDRVGIPFLQWMFIQNWKEQSGAANEFRV